MFEVSPDTLGFLMRPSGAVVQPPVNCLPLQLDSESYCEPLLGDPVAFTLSDPIPGSDDPPMTFPVYPLPSGLALLPGQSSVQTILASAVSSRPDVWSTGVPRTYDISREGPFDAYCSPMDTGIAHQLLRACRAVRIDLRPIQARRSQIIIQHMGCSYITPGS